MLREIQRVLAALKDDFLTVEVLDSTSNYVHCRVDKSDKSIGFVFGKVEELKREFSIKEYSVSQTTLEQIFNTFAKENQKKNKSK